MELGAGDSIRDWRSIVALGRNTASYKFALAQAILELGASDQDFIALEDLALPFATRVARHLETKPQGVMGSSRFLHACRWFNEGRVSVADLQDAAVELGFRNVIDAFHRVGSSDTGVRFFIDERRSGVQPGIRLTDLALTLATEKSVAETLDREAEGRWNLVESAWDEKHATGSQLIVEYDFDSEVIVPAIKGKRRPITAARWALNSYQRGRCFYCYEVINLNSGSPEYPDVDHYFPHHLMAAGLMANLDSPWNLVLACQRCNRGSRGKFGKLPHESLHERLWKRNEWLIESQHPLRETIIAAAGQSPANRRRFLKRVDSSVSGLASRIGRWSPSRKS